MLTAAAVCPHPPVLVPEVARAAAPELDGLRAACDRAVRRLPPPGAGADLLVVVGADEVTRSYGPGAPGSLRPYGVDLTVGRPAAAGPALPLSLTIGRWLLARGPAYAGVRFQGVAAGAAPADCAALGRDLAAAAGRVALLVMGDGTACRSEKAPGYFDERAAPYDAAVARALGAADAAALARLDPGLSDELRVAGRAAWQVLAGAAAGTPDLAGELLADEAPYGVGYLVAGWRAGAVT